MRCWILEETRGWRGFGQTSSHSILLPAICQTTGICLQLIRIGSLCIMHVWEGTELDLMQNKADPVCQAENGCSCILWRHRAMTLSQTTWTFTQPDDPAYVWMVKWTLLGAFAKCLRSDLEAFQEHKQQRSWKKPAPCVSKDLMKLNLPLEVAD